MYVMHSEWCLTLPRKHAANIAYHSKEMTAFGGWPIRWTTGEESKTQADGGKDAVFLEGGPKKSSKWKTKEIEVSMIINHHQSSDKTYTFPGWEMISFGG